MFRTLLVCLALSLFTACGGGDPEDFEQERVTVGAPDCSTGACK